MLNEPTELMRAFRGTALDGQAVEATFDSEVLLVDWPTPDNLLSGWRAARDAMEVTGRRPLFVADDVNLEAAFPFVAPDVLTEIDAAARTLDPWSTQELQTWTDDTPINSENLAETLQRAIGWRSILGRLHPEVPSLTEELATTVSLPTTNDVVKRWAFDRISTDPDLLAKLFDPSGVAKPSRYAEWYVPRGVRLALLPTRSAWLPLVWHDYYGVNDQSILAACLWQWHQAWGAEIVASWGTMLQFVVGRRPTFGPDAWTLSGQHLAAGKSLQMSQIELVARD